MPRTRPMIFGKPRAGLSLLRVAPPNCPCRSSSRTPPDSPITRQDET